MSFVNYNGIGTGSVSAAHAEVEEGYIFQGGIGNLHTADLILPCQGLPRISIQVQGTNDGDAGTSSTIPSLHGIVYGSIVKGAKLEGTNAVHYFELARMLIPMNANGSPSNIPAPIYMEFNIDVKYLRLYIELDNAYIADDTKYGKCYARIMAAQ